jgi:membrane protease YdiL (CAAX protease family)
MEEPNPTAAAPLPVIALASDRPRFCRACGAIWQLEWTHCGNCVRIKPAPELTVATEWRGMKSSLWLYFSLLLVCAIGVGLSKEMGGVTLELWLTAFISGITLVWCIVSAKSVLPPLQQKFNPGWLAAAVGFSFITFGIAMGVIRGLHLVLKLPDDSMSKPFLHEGYSWTAIVLFVAVQPAVIEELAFRGVIFAGISRALSGLETVLVSAMMFMILHLSPMRFPHTFALGVGAGFLRYRSKSLYPCMVMHFCHNFMCVLVEWAAR